MRKKLTLYSLALLGMLMLFNSCKKEYETIQSIDDAKIQAYIKKNNLTVTKDPSGFYFQVTNPGTGTVVLNKDSIFYSLNVQSLTGINYVSTPELSNEGTYLGYITPSSYRVALQGIKRGGKVTIILPSYLAYGKNGSGSIPSNEIIITTITVLPDASQTAIDDRLIREFLITKGITNAIKDSDGIYYIVSNVGTGTPSDINSTLSVKYIGRFLNGSIFDQTSGDGLFSFSFKDSIIDGWRKGLLGYNKGTKVRLFIPSMLAYGKVGTFDPITRRPDGKIPSNRVLDFDIEIVDVKNN